MKLEGLIPLVYLVTVAAIAAGLNYLKVPEITIGLIVGAGLMRVKIPKISGNEPPSIK
jgi:hypothetical protein